jgi:kinetochore protein Spc7/SPC105
MKSSDDPTPYLEREYQALLDELEREQAEVAASEACDQDYLAELKASIAEQKYVR